MRKLIYLYNCMHINKISLIFIFISSIFIFLIAYLNLDINLESLYHLREYNKIKFNYEYDLYNFLEIIIVTFVVILSFMELYNNSHLFDITLIAKHKKLKVLLAKIISYTLIILTYITINFLFILIISIYKFQDIYLIENILTLYIYMITTSFLMLLLSILLINLFRNYFSNFILVILIFMKRIFLEEDNNMLESILPFINQESYTISIGTLEVAIYIVFLLVMNYIIYKVKDIKT